MGEYIKGNQIDANHISKGKLGFGFILFGE